MKISRQTTLFFDASVLVAGAHSETGGSALLLNACKLGGFTAQTSFLVILEALYTLEEDFPQRSLDRFHEILVDVTWGLLPVPSRTVLEKYISLIYPDDLHVLAAAAEGRCDFLLTLGRRHTLAAVQPAQAAGLPIHILTPGDFIREYYVLHDEYALLPPRRGPS
jgi:predicted nucleic acid-binding protein